MKKLIKIIIDSLVDIDFFYFLFNKSIWRAANYIHETRKKVKLPDESHENKVVRLAISKLFPDLIVKNGPFKGMQYTEPKSIGSEFFPKLLGSYEKELHSLIKKICSTKYEQIINIGSAEG
ncbi:MAG: hypothetical protein ACOZAK_02865 [Patescibacteria group bacterium]